MKKNVTQRSMYSLCVIHCLLVYTFIAVRYFSYYFSIILILNYIRLLHEHC